MEKKIFVVGVDQMILPLTRRLIEQGALPNIKKLMDQGSVNQILPSFPAWTPTNWASAVTGAETGTHGVFAWLVDVPDGEGKRVPVSSFNSHVVNAETIWEVAEKAGLRSAIVHYPASMPSRLKEGFVVDGDASPGYGGSDYEITPSRGYTTKGEGFGLERIELRRAEGWRNLLFSGSPPLVSEIKIIPKFKGEDRDLYLLVVDSMGKGYDRILICKDKDGGTKIAEAGVGEWTSWIFEDFTMEGRRRKGTLRFKLIELSSDGKMIRLYRSQVMPVDGFTDPDELGMELIERIGPYQEHVSEFSYLSGACDYDTCVEEAEYQAMWFAKAARYLTEEKGCNLFYCHWHFLDDINHHHLAQIDPSSPLYDSRAAEKHWDMVRKAYFVIDKMVGKFVEYLNENAYLVVMSDHGNMPIHRLIFLEKFLYERGFLAVKDESLPLSVYHETWEDNIDWGKTEVYMKRGPYSDFSLYINAEGEEYERIQDELIRELRSWVDEETGKTPIAVALKKRDAVLLGCWGDQMGDVIIVLESGYHLARWGPLQPNSLSRTEILESSAGIVTAAHGTQMMTSQTEVSSNLAMLIIVGPGIKKGYERPVDQLGYIKIKDIAPTFCHILGIQPPAQSQGAVIYDLFEGHEMRREMPAIVREEREKDPRVWAQKDMFDFPTSWTPRMKSGVGFEGWALRSSE